MIYSGLPLWEQYLLQGILIFIYVACSAVVLTRAGRNPYLAFLVVIPYVQILALWIFAFTEWKKTLK